MQKHKKLFTILILALVISVGGMFAFHPTSSATSTSDLEKQLEELQKKQAEINKKKQDIQSEINKYNKQASDFQSKSNLLSAEIALLDVEISEMQAKIDTLNLSIKKLNEEIETSKAIISQTEFDAEQMQTNVDQKILQMYLDYKTGIGTTELDATLDAEDMFKKQQYKEVLLNQTAALIEELNKKLESLEKEKVGLEEKNLQIQRDKQQLDEEKAGIDSKKSNLEVQRQAFYKLQEEAQKNGQAAKGDYNVLSDEEAKVRAQAQLIQQQIFESQGSVPNGSYVVAGTRVGWQGSTGISTGPHLHFMIRVNGASKNPCSKLGSGPFANCRGDGSMPYWPLQGTHYYTSGYGNRCYNHNGTRRCNFHDGIDLASPNKNAPVFAAHDGWMYQGFDPCSGSLCNNGGANFVIICENKSNCNKGLKSGYWHLKGF